MLRVVRTPRSDRAVYVSRKSQLSVRDLHDAGFGATYVLEDLEPNLERCMADAATLLERLGRKIAVEHLSAGSTS